MDEKFLTLPTRINQLACYYLILPDGVPFMCNTPFGGGIALKWLLTPCELPPELLARVIAYPYGISKIAGSELPSSFRG
jgi:hypothetical protein